MSLVGDIKEIQAFYGTDRDGVIGPQTIRAILTDIRSRGGSQVEPEESDIDARTMEHVRSLDPKAQDRFLQFIRLAKATAATFGCDYIGIEGHRTWEEQDALYAKGRTAPGSIVTRAKGGFSNHNFGIAMDFGVFRGKSYLDDTNTDLALQVHAACAVHARKLGFDWGGDWKALKDEPHFEISTGLTLSQKRKLYQEKGSVL